MLSVYLKQLSSSQKSEIRGPYDQSHINIINILSLLLLAMIANSAVQSSTRTLFTMLFCSRALKQCLIQASSFSTWGAIFGNNRVQALPRLKRQIPQNLIINKIKILKLPDNNNLLFREIRLRENEM